MPSENDSYARGHKFPFLTGEIFECNINQIIDKFFEPPPPNTPSTVYARNDTDRDEDNEDIQKKSAGCSPLDKEFDYDDTDSPEGI